MLLIVACSLTCMFYPAEEIASVLFLHDILIDNLIDPIYITVSHQKEIEVDQHEQHKRQKSCNSNCCLGRDHRTWSMCSYGM